MRNGANAHTLSAEIMMESKNCILSVLFFLSHTLLNVKNIMAILKYVCQLYLYYAKCSCKCILKPKKGTFSEKNAHTCGFLTLSIFRHLKYPRSIF